MKPRHKRIALIFGGLVTLGIAAYFVLNALNSNIALFYTPTQVAAGEAPKSRVFRIGGLVKEGSLQRHDMTAHFIVTDTAVEIPVAYTGILPDLFKEGKGVVAQGKLGENGEFTAAEVLAKHDENYMPPEAAHAVKEAGQAGQSGKVGVADQAGQPVQPVPPGQPGQLTQPASSAASSGKPHP